MSSSSTSTSPDEQYGRERVEVLGTVEHRAAGQLLRVKGVINGVNGVFLMDTGATTEFIDKDYAKAAGIVALETKTKIKLANGTIVRALGKTRAIQFELRNHTGRVVSYGKQFEITTLDGYDAILGMSWIEEARPKLVWDVGVAGTGIEVQRRDANGRKQRVRLEIVNREEQQFIANMTVNRGKQEEKIEQEEEKEIPRGQQAQGLYERLIKEFDDVFPKELPSGLPPKREKLEHEIKLKDHRQPPYRRPYKMGPKEMEILKETIDEMMKKGFIQRSQSRYGAPVLFVPKKDGGMRMVIDYREINKITIKNGYPLPSVEELFPIVQGAKWFSKIDLHSGYYQIRIAEKDREKTAFVTRYGSYEFLVLPMGLCNSPATFMELMNWVFEKHLDKFVIVFLDDVLVFSKTLEEHERHLREVLRLLRENRLYAKMSKCDLVREEVDFLGHRLGRNGLDKEDTKVKEIVDWKVPTSRNELQQFLGLANYYRKFVDHYSTIAAPLNALTGSTAKFQWTEKEQNAFEKLKRALVQSPVLKLPDMKLPFVINTDASNEAIGAVLQQDHGNGLQPVAYYSATYTGGQRNYATHEQEMLAVVEALKHWKHLLWGAKVTVRTDHQSLQHFFKQQTLSRRQIRWMEELADYDLEIKYVKGKQNAAADALSRKTTEEQQRTSKTFKELGWNVTLNAARTGRRRGQTREEEKEDWEKCIKAAEQNQDKEENRPEAGAGGAIQMPTQRCTAMNRKGRRCGAKTKRGQYCWQHLRQKEGTRIRQSQLGKQAGNGLFAERDFEPGETIAKYTGDWLYNEDEVWGGNYVLKYNQAKSIDAARTNTGTGRWINDARGSGKRPNARFSYDRRREMALIKATKCIREGEEIYLSYGPNYWPRGQKEEQQAVSAVAPLDVMKELQREAAGDEEYIKLKKTVTAPGSEMGEWEEKDGLIRHNGIIRVPDTQRAKTIVVDQCHDELGHMGRDKTVERVKLRFYWKGMDDWIQKFVSSCVQCQRAKESNQKVPGELMPLPIPTEPWEQVGVDFMGPLKKTRSGKDGIMVVVCHLTKMKHIVPIRMASSAPEIAATMEREVVRLHGVPKIIVSDRDVRFTAGYWIQYWKAKGTEVRFSTAYHPQTDGQTERENRTISQVMRTVVDEQQDDWDRYLPLVEMALNSAVQASTGMSPYKMVYGREMVLPVDRKLETRVTTENPAVEELGKRMEEIWKKATDEIEKAKKRQERNANGRRRKEEFRVGDKVMVSTEEMRLIGTRELNKSVKFLPKYIGPFEVEQVKNRNAYKIRLPPSFRMEPVINITRLKRYVDGESMFPDREVKEDRPAGERLEDANGGAVEWEVEAIWGERGTGRRKQYLVKWKGYPMWENTWEPSENLENAQGVLEQYREALKEKESETTTMAQQMYGMATSNVGEAFKGVKSVTELTKTA